MKIETPVAGCYICLEGIEQCNRFMCLWVEGQDFTKIHTGEVAYRILGYATTHETALRILYPTKAEEDAAYMNYMIKTFMEARKNGLIEN